MRCWPSDPPSPADRIRVVTTADFTITDDQLRRAGSVKWNYADVDVLPAWVAEMDVRPCPEIAEALHDAIERGVYGYPPMDDRTGLPEATAEFLAGRFGWQVDPASVLSTGDVMAGVTLTLNHLCEPAPVVVPVPSYPPFLSVVPVTGRRLVPVPCRADDGGRPVLDLDRIDAALRAGARTVLLATPHNPLGRAFDAAELTGLRDVVLRHGARVISDEIHAPLMLAGAEHVPYASVEGTADHVTTITAASKAWNIPGLKCAQIVAGNAADLAVLRAVPLVANHGVSPLGVIATVAAYRDGLEWLNSLRAHLDAMRTLFGALLAERLPMVGWVPMEATYLAWLDARGTGLADPSAAALAKGRVLVNQGVTFGEGYDGFVRVNLATSAERLTRVVDALALAWSS
jgi:cysteine-S-conjugate beta-lyase